MEIPNKSFGVIVALSAPEFDIPKEDMFNAFHEAGIEDHFIPKERAPKKAFQKALKEAVDGEDGFMIRPVSKKGHTMMSGLVKEQKNADQKELKYDVCNVLTLNSNLEIIEGKSDFRTEAVVDSYKTYRNMLGSVELCLKLKEIVFSSMAIDILTGKCSFIPNKHRGAVDKLIKLFDNLKKAKAPVSIEVIGVDNDTETRNTIVAVFVKQTMDHLNAQLEFCLKQRTKYETGEMKFLRPTAFRKQLDKLHVLQERIRTYIVLLNMTADEDRDLVNLLETVDREITTNIEIGQNKRRPVIPS